jgi:hypothetical protein
MNGEGKLVPSFKLWAVVGGVILFLVISADPSWASTSSASKDPKITIASPHPGQGGDYNQAKYAVIKATNFPPDAPLSLVECAVRTQSDPNRCSESSWSTAVGTTNAKGEFTFSRRTGSGIILLGGAFFTDPDADYCGNGPSESVPCYVTVQDTVSGDTDITASVPYLSYCNHIQGYRCFPKARHN